MMMMMMMLMMMMMMMMMMTDNETVIVRLAKKIVLTASNMAQTSVLRGGVSDVHQQRHQPHSVRRYERGLPERRPRPVQHHPVSPGAQTWPLLLHSLVHFQTQKPGGGQRIFEGV
jgi:hypothetical protein